MLQQSFPDLLLSSVKPHHATRIHHTNENTPQQREYTTTTRTTGSAAYLAAEAPQFGLVKRILEAPKVGVPHFLIVTGTMRIGALAIATFRPAHGHACLPGGLRASAIPRDDLITLAIVAP